MSQKDQLNLLKYEQDLLHAYCAHCVCDKGDFFLVNPMEEKPGKLTTLLSKHMYQQQPKQL